MNGWIFSRLPCVQPRPGDIALFASFPAMPKILAIASAASNEKHDRIVPEHESAPHRRRDCLAASIILRRATEGTHTPCCVRACAAVANNGHPWLWVPAFAGTTDQCSRGDVRRPTAREFSRLSFEARASKLVRVPALRRACIGCAIVSCSLSLSSSPSQQADHDGGNAVADRGW